jgi:hypothetical protein
MPPRVCLRSKWFEVLTTVIPRDSVLVMNYFPVNRIEPVFSDSNEAMEFYMPLVLTVVMFKYLIATLIGTKIRWLLAVRFPKPDAAFPKISIDAGDRTVELIGNVNRRHLPLLV